MSGTFNKSINITLDKRINQPVDDDLVGLQINFIDTQIEISVQKTISVVNGPQTSTYQGKYLIIQFHFYSDDYKIFVTEKANILTAAEELYSGDASKIVVFSSRTSSNVLLSTTNKQNPSAADWKRYSLICSELDITMDDKRFVEL